MIVKNNIALVNIIIILEWIKINKKVLIIKIKTINNHYIFLKMKNKLLTNNIDLDILIINIYINLTIIIIIIIGFYGPNKKTLNGVIV